MIFEISRYRFLDLGHTKLHYIIQSFSVNIDFQWNSSIPGQSSWSVGRFSVAPNGLEYLGLGEFARWKSRQLLESSKISCFRDSPRPNVKMLSKMNYASLQRIILSEMNWYFCCQLIIWTSDNFLIINELIILKFW